MRLNNERPVYLKWLEDECFFSLCSRQHIFLGNHSAGQTLEFLFGANEGHYTHDFPSNLEQLSDDAKSAWGEAEQIIRNHTIASIFFPFQSSDNIDQLQKAMKGPHLGAIKYRLGIVTGRFGGEHPLKACHECMAFDRAKYGVAYWHLSHQFPGVTVCLKHRCLLMESTENRQWSRRFQWLLPTESALHKPRKSSPSPAALKALMAVSKSALETAKLGLSIRFEPSIVAQVYKEAITNLVTSKLEREVAAEKLARYCSNLQKHPPFSTLPCTSLGAVAFIAKMVRKPRSYCHPLRHVTLISWLFESVELFVKAYDRLAPQQKKMKNVEKNIEQASFSSEKETSVATSAQGALRPKKFTNKLKNKILKSLAEGMQKKEVCEVFSISITSVNRILRLYPETAEKIAKLIRLRERNVRRELWLSTTTGHPGLGMSDVRRLIPNTYAWLYRNDNPWLTSQSRILRNAIQGNHLKVDWNLRDENLCNEVKRVMSDRKTDGGPLRKRDVYLWVPSLFAALESRDHYPKTRAYLSEIACKPC